MDILNNCGLNSCGWCRGKVLVEVSRRDRFWGIGLGMGGREIQVNGRVKMF